MKFFAQNTERGLIPLYPSDLEEKKRLKLNKVYSCEIKFERNYEMHKKFFALCKIGCENSQNVEMPLETYRKYAIIKAGYSVRYSTPKGIFVDAESISFGSMTQEKFEKVYSDVLDFIIKDTGAEREFIEQELLSFM